MNQIYSTQDFYFAAYLLSEKCRMLSQQRRGNITTFNFGKDSRLDELVSDYYALKARVEPINYGNSVRALKSIIHNNSNSQLNGMYNNGNTINMQ